MTIYELLILIGFPSLCVSVITYLVRYIIKYMKIKETKINACALGIQAFLRLQLRSMYEEWSSKGYAPIHIREDFENCWIQYEALGQNGVMQDIHDKFFKLPIHN